MSIRVNQLFQLLSVPHLPDASRPRSFHLCDARYDDQL